MPTAVNNIDKKNGYGKIVAHVTRKYPNDSNKKDIDENLTKYNQTFHVTNFDKQLLKNVDGSWVKEHDDKALKRRHKEEMFKTKAGYIADQKKKGLIQDKRMVATVGNHEYYDEVIERVAKLHPEWDSDEVVENVVGTYNKAFKGFAKGFNQTHENLVVSRCDTNVDERPPHMHYQLTGMTKTAKGKPSFSFGKALHETYSKGQKVNKGDDYKAFREDADNALINHFKKAMVADYGKTFNDIELVRTDGLSGLSQTQREHINNQVELATKARSNELDAREDKLNQRETKIKDREDFNWKLTRENNKLKHDNENVKKQIDDAKSQFALSVYNSVQDIQGTFYHAYDWVFDDDQNTQSLTPENSMYKMVHEVQKAEPEDVSKANQSQDRAFNDITELRGIIDTNERKNGVKGVSIFGKIAAWGKGKIDTVKSGLDMYYQRVEDRINDEDEENKRQNAEDAQRNAKNAKNNQIREDDFKERQGHLKHAIGSIFRATGGVKRYFKGDDKAFDDSLDSADWPSYTVGKGDKTRHLTIDELAVENTKRFNDEVEHASKRQLQELIDEQTRQRQRRQREQDDGLDF